MSSNLVGGGIETRPLTLFALGGSGIRALEPLLHLCALGLGPRQLNLVLIDPDQSNFAVSRSRELIERYRQARALVGERGAPAGYFRTEVQDLVGRELVWSPIADEEHLPDARFSTRVDRSLMKGRQAAPLGHLFDLLYSEPVRNMDLGLGFRGIPSIGTVFMNRLREQPFFEQLLGAAQMQPDMVFFSVGSVFGGTGSAAFPVVGRALVDGIRREDRRGDVPGVAQRRIGGAILLPYFSLPTPATADAPDGGPRPEDTLFAQNAAAAIPLYTSGHAGYGGFYVLGDDQPRQQDRNEVGGAGQANRPHYVELFAALAALDFAARGGEPPNASLPVFRATGVTGNNVEWSDLPLDERSRERLMGGVVAVHTFLRVFRPNGGANPGLDRLLRGATWLDELGIKPAELRGRSGTLDAVGRFFADTWAWLAEMRASTPGLHLARADGRRPAELAPWESVEGRRDADTRRRGSDEFEVFRHWNLAAHRRRGAGFPGFLEVMREGSEAYARARFSEVIQTQETA